MLATSTTRLSAPEAALGDRAAPRASRACAQHRVGERREVEVVAEQLLGRHRLGDLDQRAGRAEHQVERVASARARRAASRSSSAFASGVAPSESTGSQVGAAARAAGGRARLMRVRPEEARGTRRSSARSPSSSVNSGAPAEHASRAFAALRYWCADLVASPRCGRRARASSSISSRIRSTSSQHGDLDLVREVERLAAQRPGRPPASRPAACTPRRRPRRRSSRGRTVPSERITGRSPRSTERIVPGTMRFQFRSPPP